MQAHEIRALLEWLKQQIKDTKYYAQSHPDLWERERAFREWGALKAQLHEVEDLLRPKRVA
jgi:hypothetical protein